MSSPIALQEFLKAGFEDFIVPNYEAAPFSTIQNRAKVTRSLKAIAGVERIMCKGINILPNEFGSNGEQVWESSDKDSRIRFVGSNWIGGSTNNGSIIYSEGAITDYVEVSFYGTGLNYLFSRNDSRDIRVSVDGGAEGGNIVVGTQSTVLTGRNYSPNSVLSITSGLALGWHTAKIRNNNATAGQNINLHGFEILNQRTDLAVYSGAGISNGSSQGLSALATSAFNAGVSGTRGARVVKYVQNGVVSQAVQEVDATSKYLTLADHTNEEVIRRINFREFGANRADDFSTLALVASSRAFTLDDGTTTLVASSTTAGSYGSTEYFAVTILNSFWTLTFVGTGLDLVESYITPTIVIDSATFFVDGVSIGSVTSGTTGVRKICSGLPYGTHTVKMVRNVVSTTSQSTSDFIIYQPKTPSIPAGALKVAAYNVMANFVAPTGTVVGAETVVSQGSLRKVNIREMTYVGTWAGPTLNVVEYPSGYFVSSLTGGSYVEYRFFGTGFGYNFGENVAAANFTVSVNGSTNLSSFSSTLKSSGLTFTPATGVVSGSPTISSSGYYLSISNIPLGYHTVRVSWVSGQAIFPANFDIITPIHAQESSLKVGSQSLKSVTKYSPEKSVANAGPDLSKAKAWVTIDQVNNKILSSYNISSVLLITTSISIIFFEKPFKNSDYAVAAIGSVAQTDTDTKLPNSCSIGNSSSAGAVIAGTLSAVFFGELIGEGEN